ncbi:alpha-(1,6)-fucosyltransferase-like [Ruditapes philippinarum]|uniref:alpha-(1,6)-fucosyltransferase-like n=1 Tax=Ruditapes philippinarum TaxID=129788 RepID=UPI00295AA7BC|nr:alpha-(1,6)-fucosyltransferase-like [Ruditapes philippinarum]
MNLRSLYLPIVIPDDVTKKITRVHSNPAGWLVGQFLVYLTRQKNTLKRFIDDKRKRIRFSHPIVGVHVRRTDKRKEAKYHFLHEYMSHVGTWYDSYEKRHGKVKRRVYLATDEPMVIRKAKESYPNYTFKYNFDSAVFAHTLKTRYSERSLHRLILDIQLLAECDFVVCTMTSNICRLVFELMHVRYWDAPDRIISLERDFRFPFYKQWRMLFNKTR